LLSEPREGEPDRVAEALSILSQLLCMSRWGAERATTASTFQFFPSCCRRSRAGLTSCAWTFNSFPVAVRSGRFVAIRDVRDPFNSFPVAVRLGSLTVTMTDRSPLSFPSFNSFPVAVFDEHDDELDQHQDAFYSFPVAV